MIKAHHGFWHRNSIRAVLLISSLAGIPLTGSAQGFPAFMATVTGRATSIAAGSNGTLIATRGVGLTAGGGWVNAGNYGVAQGAQEAVKIGAVGTIAAGGKQVPVQIAGSLSKDVIAGAIAGCLSGSIVGCVLGTATPLAIAWLTASGTRLNADGKPESGGGAGGGGCTVAPCYKYEIFASGIVESEGVAYATKELACQRFAERITAFSSGWDFVFKSVGSGSCIMDLYKKGTNELGPSNAPYGDGFRQVVAPPSSGTWNPSTPQQVKDALIQAGAPAPMMVPELEKAGVDWNKRWPGYDTGAGTPDGGMGSPVISGPSSITGEKTTTTNSDGTRTTSQSSTPMTYGPGKVTAGPTSSTTTTTNADGSTRSTSTTTTEPGTEEPKGEEDEKDTDWCEKHPERIGCIEVNVPEGTIPKETKTITFAPEDFGGSGQCPADVSMSFTSAPGIGPRQIVNWTAFCGMALPLRALVLALASIMAFFIVMPGGRVE